MNGNDLSGDITATDPDELWRAARQDYDLKPVPRHRSIPLADA